MHWQLRPHACECCSHRPLLLEDRCSLWGCSAPLAGSQTALHDAPGPTGWKPSWLEAQV